jgi:hypothetical protein
MSPASETTTRHAAPKLDDAFDQELERMALAEFEPPIEEPYAPNLLRYLRWQLQDFIKHRAIIILPLALIGLWIGHHNYDPMLLAKAQRNGRDLGVTEPEMFRGLVLMASVLLGVGGSIISAFGIVSREREGGHQRFLFAKPVRITSYYLQSFVVNGIGLLATSAIVLALTSLVFLRPVPMVEPLLGIGTAYVAIGGLAFLLSTLIRFEFVLTILLVGMSIGLREMARDGRWWAVMTAWLLPPVEKLIAFGPPQISRQPTMLSAIGSLLTYGATYIALGVAILKRRSIIR